jgi:ATP-dependent protease HslVU (ClpYQ) peptidase subunit
MTCVVGVEHPWGCELVADSQTTGGDSRPYRGRGMEKAVRRGRYLLAVAGISQFTEAFIRFQPPKPPVGAGVGFLRSEFVPALRRALRGDGLDLDNRDPEATVLEALIAVGGRLYLLDDGGGISVTDTGIYGIGGSSKYAVGALHAGASARDAVRIACELDVYTGLPVRRLTQSRQP